MKLIAHGIVQGKEILFPNALGIPDGTRIVVSIKAENAESEAPSTESFDEIMQMPFFGMRADREDMADSVAWVRKQRGWWLERLTRQG